jgi:hypothetical protein
LQYISKNGQKNATLKKERDIQQCGNTASHQKAVDKERYTHSSPRTKRLCFVTHKVRLSSLALTVTIFDFKATVSALGYGEQRVFEI